MQLWSFLLLIAGQALESKDFPKDMQMRAVEATVRIVNRSQRTEGTGVIVGRDKEGIYVLTAAHLVLHADRFEISTYSAASYPNPLKSYNKVDAVAKPDVRRDLALIRLATEDAPPAVVHFCPLDQLPTSGKFDALSVGSGTNTAPMCLLEHISKEKRFRRLGRDTSRLWETEIPQTPGRSGGPLLNKRGELIGLASGASEGKGYYCHGAEIQSWLKDSGNAFLLGEQETKGDSGDSAASQHSDEAKSEAKLAPQKNDAGEPPQGGTNEMMPLLLVGGLVLLVGLLLWVGWRAILRRRHRRFAGSRHGPRRRYRSSSGSRQ